jgi:H+-transporting ATPase
MVEKRMREWGPNELPEKKRHPLLILLSYFWGPMPIMIWIAAGVELAKASAGYGGWEDFAVLMMLQFANALVGYVEERNAGDAIAALKQQLAPQCHVCRDGKWSNMPARELVPGDLIEIKLGDVVPADATLLPGMPMQVDQAALTGESLPVNIHPGDKLKMGSAIKRGESKAVVVATGANTFFGKAAGLIASVESHGRFQKILFNITLILLVLCLVIAAIIFIKLQFFTGGNPTVMKNLSTVIVILVASIPIAIEVVCTSTLAVGSRRLAEKKIIVARLSAIEELAGMSILCSDKTGTLTLNQLALKEPVCMGDMDKNEIIFYAALCSKREEGNQDAIDLCITQAIPKEDRARLHAFKELDFMPFNPTDKRTEATVQAPDQSVFKVTKGAPQYILRMAHNKDALKGRVDQAVQELADRGFRSLGLAISYTGPGVPEHWEFQGIISLFDPPRPDTKRTIQLAGENGIEVKMVTGDHLLIAKETCRELGMGSNILNTEVLNDTTHSVEALDEIILQSHGFAEVMPEHKFQIVERIRQQGYVTGMTGDGVNDAPALKRADIGIAVFPATDAAKAAADIVLTEPGLAVIIDAIFRSRKIFQRMRNYCIYRISCTLQLLFFFFFAIMSIDGNAFYNGIGVVADRKASSTCGPNGLIANADCPGDYSFTLPVISLVIITILNDGTMITIAHDKVIPEKRPQKWAMFEVSVVACVLGAVACISSMVMLVLILKSNITSTGGFIGITMGSEGRNYVRWQEARTMMYLKISISDFLTLFSARTRVFFWERRPGYALGVACLAATGSSTLLSLFWDDAITAEDAYMKGLRSSKYACFATWVYCVLWFLVQDLAKVGTYRMLEYLGREDAERMQMQANRGKITSMISAEQRELRKKGVKIGSDEGYKSSGGHSAEMAHEIANLKKELAELKALVMNKK